MSLFVNSVDDENDFCVDKDLPASAFFTAVNGMLLCVFFYCVRENVYEGFISIVNFNYSNSSEIFTNFYLEILNYLIACNETCVKLRKNKFGNPN